MFRVVTHYSPVETRGIGTSRRDIIKCLLSSVEQDRACGRHPLLQGKISLVKLLKSQAFWKDCRAVMWEEVFFGLKRRLRNELGLWLQWWDEEVALLGVAWLQGGLSALVPPRLVNRRNRGC